MSQRNGFKGPRHHPYRDRDRDRDIMRDRGRDRDKDDTPRSSRDRDRPHRRESPKPLLEPAKSEQDQNLSIHSEGGDDVPVVVKEKKFTNRARLFIGNLSRSVTEDDLMKLFEPFGEVTQPFIEKERSYGFIRMVRQTSLFRHFFC